jgi:predicted MFS family arabinose efflux permease
VVLAAGSALGGMYGVLAMRIRQQAVAPDQRGQVFGASRMLSYGAAPLGAVLGGFALGHIDVRTLFGICAAASLATIIPMMIWLRPTGPPPG